MGITSPHRHEQKNNANESYIGTSQTITDRPTLRMGIGA